MEQAWNGLYPIADDKISQVGAYLPSDTACHSRIKLLLLLPPVGL